MKRFQVFACMALVALAVSACGGGDEGGASASSGGVEKVKVGVLPITSLAPLYVGIQQGFFRQERLEVEPAVAQGGAALLPAVLSGQYDFGFSNVVSAMIAQAGGLDIRMVAQASQSNTDADHDFGAVIVPKGSPIRRPEDLAGKSIAVNTLKNIGDLAIRAALDKRGVDTSDVKFVEIPFPDMNSALETGRVDAAWQEEPFLTQAADGGSRVVLNHYREVAQGLTIAGYIAGAKLVKSKPELVERFARAMNRSLDYTAAHPDAARKAVTTFTKIPADVAQRMVLPEWSSKINRESMERLADLGTKQGIFKSKPDVNALIAAP